MSKKTSLFLALVVFYSQGKNLQGVKPSLKKTFSFQEQLNKMDIDNTQYSPQQKKTLSYPSGTTTSEEKSTHSSSGATSSPLSNNNDNNNNNNNTSKESPQQEIIFQDPSRLSQQEEPIETKESHINPSTQLPGDSNIFFNQFFVPEFQVENMVEEECTPILSLKKEDTFLDAGLLESVQHHPKNSVITMVATTKTKEENSMKKKEIQHLGASLAFSQDKPPLQEQEILLKAPFFTSLFSENHHSPFSFVNSFSPSIGHCLFSSFNLTTLPHDFLIPEHIMVQNQEHQGPHSVEKKILFFEKNIEPVDIVPVDKKEDKKENSDKSVKVNHDDHVKNLQEENIFFKNKKNQCSGSVQNRNALQVSNENLEEPRRHNKLPTSLMTKMHKDISFTEDRLEYIFNSYFFENDGFSVGLTEKLLTKLTIVKLATPQLKKDFKIFEKSYFISQKLLITKIIQTTENFTKEFDSFSKFFSRDRNIPKILRKKQKKTITDIIFHLHWISNFFKDKDIILDFDDSLFYEDENFNKENDEEGEKKKILCIDYIANEILSNLHHLRDFKKKIENPLIAFEKEFSTFTSNEKKRFDIFTQDHKKIKEFSKLLNTLSQGMQEMLKDIRKAYHECCKFNFIDFICYRAEEIKEEIAAKKNKK